MKKNIINRQCNCKGYSIRTIVIGAIDIFLFYIIYMSVIGNSSYNPNDYYRALKDPDFIKLSTRIMNYNHINHTIDYYWRRDKTLPKNVDDLSKLVTKGRNIDPMTNKSDWEVQDRQNPEKWYRTVIEPYNELPLWNPSEHDGIYKIRPRYLTEELEIRQRWKNIFFSDFDRIEWKK